MGCKGKMQKQPHRTIMHSSSSARMWNGVPRRLGVDVIVTGIYEMAQRDGDRDNNNKAETMHQIDGTKCRWRRRDRWGSQSERKYRRLKNQSQALAFNSTESSSGRVNSTMCILTIINLLVLYIFYNLVFLFLFVQLIHI